MLRITESLVPKTVMKVAEIMAKVAALDLSSAIVLPGIVAKAGEQDELVGILPDELKKLHFISKSIEQELYAMPRDDENEVWLDAWSGTIAAERLFEEKCSEAFPEAAKRLQAIWEAKRCASFEVREGWQLVILNRSLPTVTLSA